MAYTKSKEQIKQSETIRKEREDIVNKIINDMKRDGLRWSEPYLPNLSPRNPVTGTVYKGANRFHLAVAAMQRGFTDPRWCTFQQAKKQNWDIKSGAKAAHVERWKEFRVTEDEQDGIDGDGAEEEKEEVVTTRLALVGYWNVFNAEEIEGMPPLPDLHEYDRTAEIANDLIVSSRCEVKEDAQYLGMAAYSPKLDRILIGPRSTFRSDESFTRTLLHEMTHSTGHEDALARNLSTTFGSAEYAQEELTAELGSLFVSSDLGIQTSDMEGAFYENHVSYLKSWIAALEDDPNYLFKAASAADKASVYLTDAYDAVLERKQTQELTHEQERIVVSASKTQEQSKEAEQKEEIQETAQAESNEASETREEEQEEIDQAEETIEHIEEGRENTPDELDGEAEKEEATEDEQTEDVDEPWRDNEVAEAQERGERLESSAHLFGKDRVCIGVLSQYKQGNEGAWIELPQSANEIERFLVEDVGVEDKANELRIFDTDFNGPLGLVGYDADEFDTVEDLNLLAHASAHKTEEQLEAAKLYTQSLAAQSSLEYANALEQVDDIPYYLHDDPDFALSEQSLNSGAVRDGEFGYLDLEDMRVSLKEKSANELLEEYDLEPATFTAEAIEAAETERGGYAITAADGYQRVHMSAARYNNLKRAVSTSRSERMCTNRTTLSETGWLTQEGRAKRAQEARAINARMRSAPIPEKDAERARKAARTKERPKSRTQHI